MSEQSDLTTELTRHDQTWLEKTWLDQTWQDQTWLNKTWLDQTWSKKTWLYMTWLLVWLCLSPLKATTAMSNWATEPCQAVCNYSTMFPALGCIITLDVYKGACPLKRSMNNKYHTQYVLWTALWIYQDTYGAHELFKILNSWKVLG